MLWAGWAQEEAGGGDNETLGSFLLPNLVASSFRLVAALEKTILTVEDLLEAVAGDLLEAVTLLGEETGASQDSTGLGEFFTGLRFWRWLGLAEEIRSFLVQAAGWVWQAQSQTA